MRKDELTGTLRQPYTPERGFGTARATREGYEHIWFVVPPAPPEAMPAGIEVGPISRATTILQSRPNPVDASELDLLAAYLFAGREAVSSSRMEGTWSTIDNVLTPGEAYDQGEGKSEHLSVRGYATALEYGFAQIRQHGMDAMTTELVCHLHDLVMSKDPDFHGIAGRVRTPGLPGDVVQIGGSGRKEDAIYNPAPPEHTARCLEDVMGWMRNKTLIELGDAGMGMSLPVRMAISHAHFEAVHPFSNGNGRVGRILWPLQMAGAGHLPLYLSGYVEQNKHEYGQALQEAQKQLSYGRIVEFVANAVIGSHEEEKTGKAVIGKLPGLWQQRGKCRKNSSAARALAIIIRMPIITANILSKELNVSFQAASTALNALEGKHVIRERTGHGRNRVFAAEEVIAVLARPFGEEPDIALEGARRVLGISTAI
ncbi:Fic family protein [Rhodobacteraceae bacterium R_SAG10]|nr:Fic family protein [Rhodobacteraceae bacterium R_SAG10]